MYLVLHKYNGGTGGYAAFLAFHSFHICLFGRLISEKIDQ